MFTRMFTSGVSNGRPGNPFHQGFVFSKFDIIAIVRSTADMADLEFARPVDFNDWADWLNPKGDAELEVSELEQDNPPLPGTDNSSWKLSVEKLFKEQSQQVLALFSEFEAALRESRTCKVPSTCAEDFLTKVSLLTHLIPLIPSWRMEYSTGQLSSGKATSLQMVGPDEDDAPVPGPWAQLAFDLLANDQIHNVDRSIGQLTSVLTFAEDKPFSWLAALPLAVALTPAQTLDSDLSGKLANSADAILAGLPFPASWTNAAASEMLLDSLASPNQLLRQFSRSEAVYRKLSELPIVV